MKTILNTPVLIAVFAIALSLGVFMVTQAAADIQQITVCVNNAGAMRLNFPFAQSTFHILNFQLPIEMSTQPQPLQDGFLHS